MASAFSLEGKLGLDAKAFVTGAKKAERAVGDIGDEFGKLPGDAKTATNRVGDEFGKLPADAKKAGAKAAANLDAEFGKIPGDAKAAASRAADNIEDELDDVPERSGGIGRLAGGKMGAAMIAGFGAIGVGAFLLDSMTKAMDTQRMVNKVNAAFRRTPEEAERQGQIAGDLYAGAWGESLGQLEENVALTSRRIGDLTDDELAEVVKGARAIADTWDQDFNAVIRSTGQLLENGLAPTATAALDVITAGFQDGADEAGDWMESIDEFAQHFADLGLSAEDMYSIISTGMQNGQRDADKMVDAIKELKLRATDTSDATTDAFEAIGLSADDTRARLVGSGTDARDAYLEVIDALRAVEDPVERNGLAVQLVGTQYEDLGLKGLDALAQIADGTEDVTGRTAELTDMIDDQISEWDVLKRRGESTFAAWGESMATHLNDGIDLADRFFGKVGEYGDIAGGLIGRGDADANRYVETLDAAIKKADEYAATLGDSVSSFDEARAAAVLQAAALDMGEESWTFANRAATTWTDTIGKAIKAERAQRDASRPVVEWLDRIGSGFKDAATGADASTDALEDNADALEDNTEELEAMMEALEDQITAHRRSTDSTIDAREAQFDFAEAVSDANDELADENMTVEQASRIGDQLAQSAGRMADAQVDLAADTATANGKVLSQIDRMDVWNDAMIDAAGTADGELRTSILNYIASVNGIPAEKLTEIEAAIDRGDLRTAQRLLDETSATREAAIIARTHNGQRVNDGLNWLARTRDARINVIAYYNGSALRSTGDSLIFGSVSTGIRALAGGTDSAEGGLTLVGEQGPELVNMPRGAQVWNATETEQLLAGSARPVAARRAGSAAPAAASTSNTNVNVRIDGFANETSIQHLRDALNEVERRKVGAL